MPKILVTGGPVPANLDAVKIITNKFKGGLMATLAEELAKIKGNEVTYLTYKGATCPDLHAGEGIDLVEHTGFEDYRHKTKAFSSMSDIVILGAAVANLIPANPWKGKFPSHDYKEGDIIPIEFTIAPRVVSEVKRYAPHVKLFAFKLLNQVSQEELVHAAYDIVLDAHATAVFANDASNLDEIIAITKERGQHKMTRKDMAKHIMKWSKDEFYFSELVPKEQSRELNDTQTKEMQEFIARAQELDPALFPEHNGIIFGTVAMRQDQGFLTTSRGKNELESFTRVEQVDHTNKVVWVHNKKATLNAPLLDRIFKENPKVQYIIHGHKQKPLIPSVAYTQPGSVAEMEAPLTTTSFNILDHGCYLLLDKNWKIL